MADGALRQWQATKREAAIEAEEEAEKCLFHSRINTELANLRWDARRSLHATVYRESRPPTRTVRRAAQALFKRQMTCFAEPDQELAIQMWRDHVFLRHRRIAILHSIHPRVGQDSSMRLLGLDMLRVIIEIADPWIDALTSKSRAEYMITADPPTALLDGPSSPSAAVAAEVRTAAALDASTAEANLAAASAAVGPSEAAGASAGAACGAGTRPCPVCNRLYALTQSMGRRRRGSARRQAERTGPRTRSPSPLCSNPGPAWYVLVYRAKLVHPSEFECVRSRQGGRSGGVGPRLCGL